MTTKKGGEIDMYTNQVSINRAMRDSIRILSATQASVEFDGKTGNHYTIWDGALEHENQTVKIQKNKGNGVVETFVMPAADFELLVELMQLDKRGMRKVEDED